MKTAPYHILKYSLLLLFLQSLFAWFLWGQLVGIIILCVAVTSFIAFTSSGSVYSFKKSNLIPIFFMILVQLYVIRDQNTNALIAAVLRIIIISIILLLNDKIKIDLFQFLTNSFAVILGISIFAWILFLIGIPFPYFETVFGDEQYLFRNYYFFLYNHMDDLLPVPRFSSIFLEPGQLGMMTSFFLCANRFELRRKEVLVIFIATIFTFSLVAYILLAISAFVYFISYSKKPTVSAIGWILFLILFYYFFITYNNGNNVINNLIFSRFGSGDNEIVQNNRFSDEMEVYFNRFIGLDDLVSGIGSVQYEKLFLGANAGYKVFLIQYGVVGTLLIFLFYLTVVIGKSTKMAWILLLVYVLCFLQAAYPLWECELILFITAIPFFKFDKQKSINERKSTI